MSSKQTPLDTPEWVNRDEIDNFLQQTRSFTMPQNQQFGPHEHVIPISIEKTPTRTPSAPNYGPTPFYGTPQHQINSVITPKVGELNNHIRSIDVILSNIYYKFSPQLDPNANKFVNQGYNNIEFPQTPQQPMRPYVQAQKQQQPAGTRIIPIQVEGARAPQQNENTIVIQR